jgi:hypothetical protein
MKKNRSGAESKPRREAAAIFSRLPLESWVLCGANVILVL